MVTTAIAYHTNLLVPALSGPLFDPFAPAPCGGGWSWASSAEGSRTMRYALPSGITRESSPTVIVSEPRMLFTSNCFSPSTVTCPTVGSSYWGLITAVKAFNANAFALEVENVPDPRSSVAVGVPPSSLTVAAEAAESRNRAAWVRNWTLPMSAVLRRSPSKIVVPTVTPAPPTLAPSDDTTVPSAPVVAPHTG